MKREIVLRNLSSRETYRVNLPCVIGRSDKADLKFSDRSISQHHALIEEIDNEIWIKDLESANGVLVNRQKIEAAAILEAGDSIQLGHTKLLVSPEDDDVFKQTDVLHSVTPKGIEELEHEKLRLIYDITTELSENQDLPVLVESTFSRLHEIFKQDRNYLGLFQEDGKLKPISPDAFSGPVPLSTTIVNRLFEKGEAFLLEDALSEEALKRKESVLALRIRSALCAPLIHHNQIHGVIYLDRNIPGAYNQDDLEFLRTIALLLAPLIENARLWSELKKHYANAMETLKETQARLIEMERRAAYVRLAQAMAHEIRNPLMAMGGLVRRLGQSESKSSGNPKFQAIMSLVERVEMILNEVDGFVKLPPVSLKLDRIDLLLEEAIDSHDWELLKDGRRPTLSVDTSHVTVPFDPNLIKKAFSMIFKEILLSIPQGSEFSITIRHSDDDVEILIGEISEIKQLCELFDQELQGKPWGSGLFLNIAHKIIADHRGKLLLDPEGNSAFPVVIKIPRTIKARDK